MSDSSLLIVLVTLLLCAGSVIAYHPSLRERVWWLVGKRPLLAPQRSWPHVFRLSPYEVTPEALEARYREWQLRIRRESYFKTRDRALLAQYFQAAQSDLKQTQEATTTNQEAPVSPGPVEDEPASAQQGLMLTEAQHWRHVLEVGPYEREFLVIKRAYRRQALIAHPDRGGSDEAMTRVNAAFMAAKRELGLP